MSGIFSRWAHVLARTNLERTSTQAEELEETQELAYANVVTSRLVDSPLHTLMIDLDVPATLVPSSTPGHSHLYIDVPMDWLVYREVLHTLANAGIVQDGYVQASIRRGFTSLRLPWISKGPDEPAPTNMTDAWDLRAQGSSIEPGGGRPPVNTDIPVGGTNGPAF